MEQGRNRRESLVMDVKIYIEGGGNSKEEHIRFREGFRKLIEKTGVAKMPRTVPCGGRGETFRDFKNGLRNPSQVSLLLLDSEDPVTDLTDEIDNDFAWRHLAARDRWQRPDETQNHQAMLMATCMETWITADRASLREHFGAQIQENALPPLQNLEARDRHIVQDALAHATRNSKKAYRKGLRSFEVLAVLSPEALAAHLTQFRRFISVLEKVLGKKSR